jgi:hypothetical protein
MKSINFRFSSIVAKGCIYFFTSDEVMWGLPQERVGVTLGYTTFSLESCHDKRMMYLLYISISTLMLTVILGTFIRYI